MLVNPLSGGVGPKALDEATKILADYACDASFVALDGEHFDDQVQAAIDARGV